MDRPIADLIVVKGRCPLLCLLGRNGAIHCHVIVDGEMWGSTGTAIKEDHKLARVVALATGYRTFVAWELWPRRRAR